MSKTIMIPESMSPFEVIINGVKHSYQAGTEQEVPDEVAEIVQRYSEARKKPSGGSSGGNSGGWDAVIVCNASSLSSDDTSGFSFDCGSYDAIKNKVLSGEKPRVLMKWEYVYGGTTWVNMAEPVYIACPDENINMALKWFWECSICEMSITPAGVFTAFTVSY